MKILVTGGEGFIGHNLINRLIKEKHEVHSLDNKSSSSNYNINSECNYISGDVENICLLDKDFDLIYHLAALVRVQESFNNPEKTIEVNTMGTQKVCEFARLTGAKLVYAGSASRHTNPYLSPYALSKYGGEEICKMYRATYGLDIEIARFYNVYGPGEHLDDKESSVIGIWRHKIKHKKILNIVGDGEQKRDFIHVFDIVDGLWRIGIKSLKHKDAWELGTGEMTSILELSNMFKIQFKCAFNFIEDQPGNVRESIVINNDASLLLGWKPKRSLINYISSL